MLEIIKSFVCGVPKQSGELRGKYYIRRGACNTCGKCCTNIYLVHHNKTIETIEDFEALQPHNPEYQFFIPLDEDEHGVRFQCRHLTRENRCAIYHQRPTFCRKYPSEIGIMMGGQLAQGCGYSF